MHNENLFKNLKKIDHKNIIKILNKISKHADILELGSSPILVSLI